MITSLLGDPGAAGPSRIESIARNRGEELIVRDGKPNILVIWGDDIGITNLSCYSDG